MISKGVVKTIKIYHTSIDIVVYHKSNSDSFSTIGPDSVVGNNQGDFVQTSEAKCRGRDAQHLAGFNVSALTRRQCDDIERFRCWGIEKTRLPIYHTERK